MNRENRVGILAAIVGNGIFGFSFMFSRIALDVAAPFVLLMYRFILAFALLALIALWSARFRKAPERQGAQADWLRFNLKGRRLAPLMLMGIVQPVGYFLCESYGISLSNSTFAGVIIATGPLAALAAGALALREYPKKSQVVFSLISIAGVVIMTLLQRAEGEVRLGGVVLLVGAVACGTGFAVISRKLSGEFSALERTCVMMFIAAVSFTAMAVIQCRGSWTLLTAPLHNPGFVGAVLYLGVASSVVAFMALNVASGCLPVAKTMAFCNMTTVISLFAGVIFLHEPFNLVSLFASVLIILGIWGVQRQ